MEHRKLCSTRSENDIGDGYEGICDCAEIYKHELAEARAEVERLNVILKNNGMDKLIFKKGE